MVYGNGYMPLFSGSHLLCTGYFYAFKAPAACIKHKQQSKPVSPFDFWVSMCSWRAAWDFCLGLHGSASGNKRGCKLRGGCLVVECCPLQIDAVDDEHFPHCSQQLCLLTISICNE